LPFKNPLKKADNLNNCFNKTYVVMEGIMKKVKIIALSLGILLSLPLFATEEIGNRVNKDIGNGSKVWVLVDLIKEYDQNGNLLSKVDRDGNSHFYKYDTNNNCVYEKTGSGYEYWFEYDKSNHKTHQKKPTEMNTGFSTIKTETATLQRLLME